MKNFDKLVQEAIERIPEDEVLSSDLATIKGKAGEVKLNGGMKIAGQRSDDYKKAMHTFRVCNVCGNHLEKSSGRYPSYCPSCGDKVDDKDKEVSVEEGINERNFQKLVLSLIKDGYGGDGIIEELINQTGFRKDIIFDKLDRLNLLKRANIVEGTKEEYQEFFQKKLKQWKIKSPSELSKEDKAKFFKEVEDEYTKEDPKTDDGDE